MTPQLTHLKTKSAADSLDQKGFPKIQPQNSETFEEGALPPGNEASTATGGGSKTSSTGINFSITRT